MQTFTDTKFMTAQEKQKVLKAWTMFLTHGLQKKHFTKALYNHLHLHCGFIAHYNQQGFYGTYFSGDQTDLETFFAHFDRSHRYFNHPMVDYLDLTTAMIEVYEQNKNTILQNTATETENRFNLLKECIKRAETDIDFRKKILSRMFS